MYASSLAVVNEKDIRCVVPADGVLGRLSIYPPDILPFALCLVQMKTLCFVPSNVTSFEKVYSVLG